MDCCSVCRKRSPKGGFFVIIDKGEENVSKRNHGKKHELHLQKSNFWGAVHYQDGLSLSDDYLIQKCNYYKYDAVKRQGYIRALKERFTDYEIREMLREGILKK